MAVTLQSALPTRRFTPVRLDAQHSIVQEAGRHLRRALGRQADRFVVAADDECVYLAGRVGSWYEKQAAQEAVGQSTGGRRVINDLMVA